MESTKDLKDWTNPDLSLPEEKAPKTDTRHCLGCGAKLTDTQTPHCGH